MAARALDAVVGAVFGGGAGGLVAVFGRDGAGAPALVAGAWGGLAVVALLVADAVPQLVSLAVGALGCWFHVLWTFRFAVKHGHVDGVVLLTGVVPMYKNLDVK